MENVSATGRPIFIRRRAVNEIADTVNYVNRNKPAIEFKNKNAMQNPCKVLIQNGTDTNIRQWDALSLYFPLVVPVDDFYEFADNLTFICDAIATTTDSIAIANEPIPAGKFGWATVAGLSKCYLMRDAGNEDEFAQPDPGTGTLLAAKSGYKILWEAVAADGVERLALILMPAGGGAVELSKRRQIVAVGGDTLTVVNWEGTSWGSAIKTICKPYLLRTSITSRGGQTFTYSNGFTRVATQGASTENQIIVPSYVAGDEIYTGTVDSTGILDVDGNEILDVDLNGSARAWAKV